MAKTETKPEAETTPPPTSTRVSDPELVGLNKIIKTFEALPDDQCKARVLSYLVCRYGGGRVSVNVVERNGAVEP